MTEQKTWIEKLLKFGSPRSDRRSVKQFAAYRWNGSALQQTLGEKYKSDRSLHCHGRTMGARHYRLLDIAAGRASGVES